MAFLSEQFPVAVVVVAVIDVAAVVAFAAVVAGVAFAAAIIIVLGRELMFLSELN